MTATIWPTQEMEEGWLAAGLISTNLDDGIADAVALLWKAGFKTFTSCEGGKGHSFRHATIGLELDGAYSSFQKRIVRFLRSQGMQNFTISLVADYSPDHPAGKSCVYVEGLDLLSEDKRRKVIAAVKRRERRLRRQLRDLGIDEFSGVPMLAALAKGSYLKE